MSNPIRTIVAGVARPEAADPALAAAAALARATGAALHLVHVFEVPPVFTLSTELSLLYPEARRRWEAELRETLEAAGRAAAPGMEVVAHALTGSPGDRILETAREARAELVVVGASHRGTLGQALLGSAAQRVVRGSRAPVLVVRRPVERPLRRLLLTTDLSPLSAGVHEAAVGVVEALFAGDRPRVRSLAVVHYGILPPPLPPALLHETARAELAAFLAARGGPPGAVEPSVRTGLPADEIVAEAHAWEADLLVVGTHARRGVERFFLGSVAEAALRGVPCNVLVIPPAPAAAAGGQEPEGAERAPAAVPA
jgi:nucleotide-binding universal stress UspA family protein